MPGLRRILIDYDPDLLAILAESWDVELSVGDRLVMAAALADEMLKPEAVQVLWERLGEKEREALFELLASNGQIAFAQFQRRWGELRLMGPARREREKPWMHPAGVTESLFYRGLIARGFEQSVLGVQEFALIPEDLRELLPQPRKEVLAVTPGYAVAPPPRLRDGYDTAVDDIATLLAYVRVRAPDASRWLEPGPIPELDRHLRRPDSPEYRALICGLAYDLDLIHDVDLMGHITTQVNRETAQPWLEAPRAHQIRSLSETWLLTARFNELSITPGLDAEDWPNDPRLARKALLDTLADVPAQIWWSIDGLIEYIREHNPDFQRPAGDYHAWYIRDSYSAGLLQGLDYWEQIEGGLLRTLIEGPLRWLGLIRVGGGALLLTEYGLALLRRGDWPSTPDQKQPARISEQGLILMPISASRYDRYRLARFTSWVSSPGIVEYSAGGSSRDDSAYAYRITPQALARTANEKVSISGQILPFLQKITENRLPASFVKMLKDWEAQPAQVVVQDVVILTAKNLGVLERLRKQPGFQQWLGRQVGPNAFVVKRENLAPVLNTLRNMGILPLFEDHEKDDRP